MSDRIYISTSKASGVQQQIGPGESMIGIMKWICLIENGLNLLSKIDSILFKLPFGKILQNRLFSSSTFSYHFSLYSKV